jgi:hypothetical protein
MEANQLLDLKNGQLINSVWMDSRNACLKWLVTG